MQERLYLGRKNFCTGICFLFIIFQTVEGSATEDAE